MAGWQIKTDDGQLFVGYLLSQYFPASIVQAGESVNLLNEDDVAAFLRGGGAVMRCCYPTSGQ